MKLIPDGLAPALAAAFMLLAAASASAQPAQPDYASPGDAAQALADAVRAEDPQAIAALMGPGSDEWLFTGDRVADRAEWTRFLSSWDEKHAIERTGDASAVLVVGKDDWPFPAPIVKQGERWHFDGEAGREEVTVRRVGRNELDTIQTLLAIVDAQREYASEDADGNGYNDYARRFLSSEGTKDGLYWPVQPGEPQSPLGPLVGWAAQEGYGSEPREDGPRAYHGYYYRLLTGQGAHAPGGAYDYDVRGHLIGGFAIVAWPSRYEVSGIMTFMVNHLGRVYQKDLGEDSGKTAEAMTLFDPDASWQRID